LIMSPNISVPKEIEEYAATLPPKERDEFWKRVLAEIDRFAAMSPEKQEEEIARVDEKWALATEKLRLLEMEPEKMEAEVKKMQEEAQKFSKEAEKIWDEAVMGAATFLIEEDAARRKEEAEILKSLAAEKTADLVEGLKNFLVKGSPAGVGAVLKKATAGGRLGEILNYYGYSSNVSGMHRFFNEVIIGEKPIIGEKAFDNFILQQKAYALEQDVSNLAQGLNQWCLSFAVGRKKRAWYQLDEKEHLLILAWALKKFKPEVAARNFSSSSYGSRAPREKFNFAAVRDFELGEEGKLILMMFADVFEKQLIKKEFNPEAAEILRGEVDELEAMGVKPTFVEALGGYMEQLKIKPEMAREAEEEINK